MYCTSFFLPNFFSHYIFIIILFIIITFFHFTTINLLNFFPSYLCLIPPHCRRLLLHNSQKSESKVKYTKTFGILKIDPHLPPLSLYNHHHHHYQTISHLTFIFLLSFLRRVFVYCAKTNTKTEKNVQQKSKYTHKHAKNDRCWACHYQLTSR